MDQGRLRNEGRRRQAPPLWSKLYELFSLTQPVQKGDVSELQPQSQVRKAVGSNEKNVAIKIWNEKSKNLRSFS